MHYFDWLTLLSIDQLRDFNRILFDSFPIFYDRRGTRIKKKSVIH